MDDADFQVNHILCANAQSQQVYPRKMMLPGTHESFGFMCADS